jgi:cytochrome o ubiquinol oxidase operon protein cyoD
MSHSHEAGHDHASHGSHGSLKSYTVGFVLSIVLTLISFWIVLGGSVAHDSIELWLALFAVLQLLVQLGFFLHLGNNPAQRQNTAIFLFTALVLGIAVGGSLWVMHNANILMMPNM